MTISNQDSELAKELQYQGLCGVYRGTGRSKRIAEIAACKAALQSWDNQKILSKRKFEEHVRKLSVKH